MKLPGSVIKRLLRYKRPPELEVADDDPDVLVGPDRLGECRNALAGLDDAVDGAGGHDVTLRAACEIRRHRIYGEQGYELLQWFNDNKCFPPWEDWELKHKWDDARKFEPSITAEFDRVVGDIADVAQKAARRIKVLTSNELANTKYENRFLIDRVVVESQPLIVGAPSKGCKTTLAVAAAVSVATGEPFLGHELFSVSKPAVTLVMSGESGLATLKETAQRIAKSFGRQLADITNLYWSEQLPQFDSPSLIAETKAYIEELGIKFLIIDPVYLAMPGTDANNVIVMGRLLRNISEICQDAGVTLMLLHHLKKTRQVKGSVELGDMSWAGFSEFARQWWLIDRRSKFQGGIHDLKLSAGGSAGHHGEWLIQIDEGQPDDILTQRKWDVSVMAANEADGDDFEQFGIGDKETEKSGRLLAVFGESDGPMSKSAAMREAGMNYATGGKILEELVARGMVRQIGTKYELASDAEIEF